MKLKKVCAFAIAIVMGMTALSGCTTTEQPTATAGTATTATSTGAAPAGKVKELKLAHNLNEQHSVHVAITEFARLVEEKTNGSVKVTIFPNGQLGSEADVLAQLQAGAVGMTKVSAGSLTSYEPGYNAFTLPYVFNDADHFYKCMESQEVKTLYQATKDTGFVGLTYYTSGARNFYTKDTPIIKPEDLKGLKIRVMDTPSQIAMVEAMGGTPVGMPYGDVYTSLQSGVIDGTENNETALTNGKHGEVCKNYSLDEHTRIPDILVISSKVLDTFTPEERSAIQAASIESTEFHKPLWDKSIEDAVNEAKTTMQVIFQEVDKAPFREATQSVRDNFSTQFPEVKVLLDSFTKIQ